MCSIASAVRKESSVEQPVKTSSFQLPNNETVEIVFVRLASGKLAIRTPDQLVARPTPAPPKP